MLHDLTDPRSLSNRPNSTIEALVDSRPGILRNRIAVRKERARVDHLGDNVFERRCADEAHCHFRFGFEELDGVLDYDQKN
mgnify:CR=1 FL=1